MILVLFKSARQQVFTSLDLSLIVFGEVDPRRRHPPEADRYRKRVIERSNNVGAPRHSEATTGNAGVVVTALCRRAVESAIAWERFGAARRTQRNIRDGFYFLMDSDAGVALGELAAWPLVSGLELSWAWLSLSQ